MVAAGMGLVALVVLGIAIGIVLVVSFASRREDRAWAEEAGLETLKATREDKQYKRRRWAAPAILDVVTDLDHGPVVLRPVGRSRPASSLINIAAGMLPASARDRYAAEYSAELHDLAQAGAGRLRQLMYGLRVIIRTVPLRFTLRAPRRESAAP
jgi:hypothetical protein